MSLIEFIADSKVLLDFTRCTTMATKYKEKEFNTRFYSYQVVELEKKMKSEDVAAKVLVLAVEKYFCGTNAVDAIEAAINEVKEETGKNPRETVLKIIDGRCKNE